MTHVANPVTAPKLDGVVATESSICFLSADDNRLAYRGYDVADLARRASYEETAFLLLAGRLPIRAELRDFIRFLKGFLKLPRPVLKVARNVAAADPMTALRTAVSALGLKPVTGGGPAGVPAEAVALVARVPVLVATLYRLKRGERPLAPRRGLGLAANLLYLLRGREPEPEVARAFDAALILRADNELNPSTFAARVAAATKADLAGCITAALAALAGPRHGGHSLAVYRLLERIGVPERVDGVVRESLAGSRGFPGFGHPVYRGEDPRTAAMREAAERAAAAAGRSEWLVLARAVEARVHEETGLYPNVDFYLAPLYHALEIPPELFTPLFAAARISGWVAHVLEQYAQEGLIRPRAAYVGPTRREFRPIGRR